MISVYTCNNPATPITLKRYAAHLRTNQNLLLTAPLKSNPPLHPPSPFSPRPDPQPHRANSTRPHSLKRALPAATPSTKRLSLSRPLLIHKTVYSTPDRRPSRGHRGHVTPVSAEVLHGPRRRRR